MKERISRTAAIDETLLSRLENGETLTSICSEEDMPTLRAVQKWRRKDLEFEDAVHKSWVRGLAIRFDANADVQQELIEHPERFDPKVINALATITRDRSHQIIAAQSKLDRRYSDRSSVEHTGSPMIIGWATGSSDVENRAASDKPQKNIKKSDEDVVHVSKH